MKYFEIEKIKTLLPGKCNIIRKEEFFNSAVLIPLVKIDDDYHLVFEKRAANIRQGGEISFPGGEIDETDIDSEFTAFRETKEELGVDKKNIKMIGELGIFVGPMGVTVEAFVAELKEVNIDKLNFDKVEVERLFTVPISYFINNQPEVYKVRMEVQPYFVDDDGNRIETFPAKELDLPPRYHAPWYGRHNKIYLYKTNGEVIWGITAGIIYEFVSLIKDNLDL